MTKSLEVAIVVAGGAMGGLLSVLDSWADPVSYPLTLSKLAALFLIPVLKGGTAAGIGVYLLTTLDSTQLIRGFFFSVTCGLTFPTILSNSTSYAQKVTSQVATKSIFENTEKLKAAVASIGTSASPQSLLPSAVSEIQGASIAILQATPKVEPAEAKAADAVVQQAVSNLAETANVTNSDKTIEAISQIGSVAVAQNLPGTTDRAVLELKSLRDAPHVSEETKGRAVLAIQKLERANLLAK
ncbi:MAG: hypothetical protein L0387_20060 [Acidobacteria bacterium]|nr:hypothetical protein [Acidobacteriota bacterium]MCI0722231.1 hypothetical protein [Acidobacteriota bacterium]